MPLAKIDMLCGPSFRHSHFPRRGSSYLWWCFELFKQKFSISM